MDTTYASRSSTNFTRLVYLSVKSWRVVLWNQSMQSDADESGPWQSLLLAECRRSQSGESDVLYNNQSVIAQKQLWTSMSGFHRIASLRGY